MTAQAAGVGLAVHPGHASAPAPGTLIRWEVGHPVHSVLQPQDQLDWNAPVLGI